MKNLYLITVCIIAMLAPAHGQQVTKAAGKARNNPQTAIQQNKQQAQTFLSTTDLSDNFDTYTDFSMAFSPWTLVDLDLTETWGITDVVFPNQYSPMAFIIFNPSTTTPAMTQTEIQPHSGSKFAACFASNGAQNNDWLISPQVALGTNSSVSFWVKSFTAQYGLERYKVGVSTTNTDPASFTIISGASYLEASATAWEQKTFSLNAYNGQSVYVGIQCVSNDAFIFMVDDFAVTTTTATTSTLTGKVTDALNGNNLAGATVSIAGLTAVTDASGNYTINNVPAGTLNAGFSANITSGNAPLNVQFTDQSTEGAHTVTCSKSGYITYSNNQVNIGAGETLTLNISLSPQLAAGSLRFVLNWGAEPTDLDAHLDTPEIGGNVYHVYYDSPGNETAPPYAMLDYDVTSGYGPETMTIHQLYNGTYKFYVHNYSGSPDISTSQAFVQIYNQNGLLQTVQIPSSGTGTYWYVCDVAGSNGQITIKNTIQVNSPGLGKGEMLPPKAKPETKAARNIVSWLWNFGDGATSTSQNPSHTYTNPGTYTVSLTVSDGTTQDTETKSAFITVNGSSGSGTLSGLVTDALNGNPVPGATVSVAGLTTTTDASGNYSISGISAGTIIANFSANVTSGLAPLAVSFFDQSTENSNTVVCSKTGYLTYSNNQVIIPQGGSLALNISLSPELTAGAMRFVLNWGETPSDLDSHLLTPSIEGTSYHISYSDMGSETTAPYALLDHDVTDGYGPETMTIHQMFAGTYSYYIDNYSESPDITTSVAVVQIYNQNGLYQTLQVPTTGTGLYWYVCDVNGSNAQITIKNVIVETPPGGKQMHQNKTKPHREAENIVSWQWNFGDGGTSTLQNPSHTYTANGLYTVSLTVSDGTNQSTESKVAYIQVGPQAISENELSQAIHLYPIPASETLHIESPVSIDWLTLCDLQGREVMATSPKKASFQLNLTGLDNGIYLMQLQTKSGKASRKVIIN